MSKKTFTALLLTLFLVPIGVYAQRYELLQPIQGFLPSTTSGENLTDYLNGFLRIFITAAGILAVFMIVFGGIQYMTTDVVTKKTDGRNRIFAAVGGLVLALAAWIILNTINPQLLNTDLGTSFRNTGFTPAQGDSLTGFDATGNILDPISAIQDVIAEVTAFAQEYQDAVTGTDAEFQAALNRVRNSSLPDELKEEGIAYLQLGRATFLHNAYPTESSYQALIDAINNSPATPEEKQAALRNLQQQRNSGYHLQNAGDGVQITPGHAAIDTDGVGEPPFHDATRQGETSHLDGTLDANKHYFVVVPVGSPIPLGTWVTVTNHTTGESERAIVGDRGPRYGEMSLALAERLRLWFPGDGDAVRLQDNQRDHHEVTYTFHIGESPHESIEGIPGNSN